MADSETKHTPLNQCHRNLKAKMVPFGGWEMPVSYEGVLDEHHHVRNSVGVFDVSHMGELFVSGSQASDFLQRMTINDINRLIPGMGQYTALCNEAGGMIDDLIIYCLEEETYLLCVNAANTEKDFAWIEQHSRSWSGVEVKNESSGWAQLAVQGPKCLGVLRSVLDPEEFDRVASLKFTGISWITFQGRKSLLARTGYTGEKGFEWYMPAAQATDIWEALLATREETGLKPIGLGARDTLRLESCYLLYGQDMDDSVSPLEAGIGWATRFEAGEFCGRQPLMAQKEAGVSRRIYAFKMKEQGIPRQGMEVFLGEELLGKVTSGSVLPTLGGAGGMALLGTKKVKAGDQVLINIRGKMKEAVIEKRPMYTAKVSQ